MERCDVVEKSEKVVEGFLQEVNGEGLSGHYETKVLRHVPPLGSFVFGEDAQVTPKSEAFVALTQNPFSPAPQK